MKILLSAYACEPGKGSEPGVGWNWVSQMAPRHQVWVLTRSANRETIEAAHTDGSLGDVHWVYFDLPRWLRFWKKGERGVHAYYYLWQAGAYFVARKLHGQIRFDLVHHVTFVNYWMPSFLAFLPVPFVWGPVGGGESSPRSFYSSFSLRGQIYELMRNLARVVAYLDPFARLTARRASLAFSTARDTERRLKSLGCRNAAIYPEAGLCGEEIRRLGTFPLRQDAPFRLLSIGRLIHWKGFDLSLKAFARFQHEFPASEYWLIGDGPERKRLERLARKLGITEKVSFWGSQPRSVVMDKLTACDALIHPSLHDSGGWVCLEAMAAGRPVVCLDLGGPAIQVTEETGIKVPAVTPEQVVGDLAAALNRLAAYPGLRAQLGSEGRRRVETLFHWHKKADFMMKVYSQFAAEEGNR